MRRAPKRITTLASARWLTVVIALACLGSPAGAADPNTPRIGPEVGPKVKVERILATLPAADAAAWRTRIASGEVPVRDALQKLLVEKVEAYRSAMASFDKDGTNAEDFQKLEQTDAGPLTGPLRAHATFFEGRARLNRDEFDLACQCFDKLRRELSSYTAWVDEATFYLGYAYARRPELENDRERLFRMRARHFFETLAPDFAGREKGDTKPVELDASERATLAAVPERDREGAIWLMRELLGEGSGPLLELARRMETIQREIDHEHTGKPTQRKQQAVIVELDRLIELLRQREQDGGGDSNGGGKKGNRPGGQGGQNAGAPAGRSTIPGSGLSPGELNKPKVNGSADWPPDLPDRERDAVLQAVRDGRFPERYKDIIEQYMKSLSDDAGKKPGAASPRPSATDTPTPPATDKKKEPGER
jgi:hypothetical protein